MLAAILSFFLLIIVFGFQPFTSTLIIPSFIRIPALLFLTGCFFLFSYKKKKAFNFFVLFFPLAVVLLFLWRRSSPQSTSASIFNLSLIALSVSMLMAVKRVAYLMQFITAFLFTLVIVSSLASIISFIGFNLHLFPYQFLRLGGFEFYEYYYNPLLGYIAPKRFESGTIGRACFFMFEPSYLSWFLTTNFFLVDTYLKNDRWRALFVKPLVFAGAMCTFSTGAWVVFGALFSINCAKFIMKHLSFREQTIKRTIRISLIVMVVVALFVPSELIGDKLGTSSLGDREKRTQASLLFLATANVAELAVGRAPGFVENNSEIAESNQYIKLLVEEGIIGTILIVGFVIFCTRDKDNYMLATLLFLNSVVLLWTPLFMLNILVCKFGWGNDTLEDQREVLMKGAHT